MLREYIPVPVNLKYLDLSSNWHVLKGFLILDAKLSYVLCAMSVDWTHARMLAFMNNSQINEKLKDELIHVIS